MMEHRIETIDRKGYVQVRFIGYWPKGHGDRIAGEIFAAVVASGHRRALLDSREAGRMDADTWIHPETVVPGCLSYTHITGPKAVSGKNDLPQLVLAGAKGARTGVVHPFVQHESKQVVADIVVTPTDVKCAPTAR